MSETRRARWISERDESRSLADRMRRQIPEYRRLATYPWLTFPRRGEQRDYLDAWERDYLNRTRERRSAMLWAGGGAAGATLLILIPLVIVVRLTRGADLRSAGPGAGPGSGTAE